MTANPESMRKREHTSVGLTIKELSDEIVTLHGWNENVQMETTFLTAGSLMFTDNSLSLHNVW